MKEINLIITLTAWILFAFAPFAQKENLKKNLVGEWRNIYLKITLNTINNGTGSEISEADSANWEQTLHIKPIRTFFAANGTYHSDYYTLRDSLFHSVSGIWTVSHDSLTMNQQKPKVASYKFKVFLHHGIAQFEGMLDFDEDGKADDHYFGKQRKEK